MGTKRQQPDAKDAKDSRRTQKENQKNFEFSFASFA